MATSLARPPDRFRLPKLSLSPFASRSLCTDNLWSDQSLEMDTDLPPGWRKIHDTLGTYYWHVPTGTTQWQHPAHTTSPGGCLKADGEETLQETVGDVGRGPHGFALQEVGLPACSASSWYAGVPVSHSHHPRCVSAQCFAVRSLGWVEIPEEDLAPGKSSIAVNNCIQQLSNSKVPPDSLQGQDLVMILKKDTMSLVDPLDHSLIHCQPILNIRVWGVGCNNGRCWRDFAFVASDKDTCVLKCHVFHCNVPAKGIAKGLQARVDRALSWPWCSRGVDILDAVRQSIQKYEALYIGSLPVPRAMGMDVLNEAIEKLTRSPGRECWTPSLISVSDTAMRVHPAQEEERPHIWECQVRYVTFLGVGRDAHTFALIVDTGQHFQCTAVQAACMVQYQKCLVAAAPGARPKRAPVEGQRAAAAAAAAGEAPSGEVPKANGGSGGAAGPGPRKRGVFSFLEAFRQKHSLLHLP
uniref:Amyloid beta precursor protein binding family B member 3 n=1 Tax=Anas platyrhynchos TaxID=8839 RepID=A0A8B9SWI7_ANAPL